ncbi:MAG: hypothetical protein A4S16_06745 [Proteobacteria bacterium SG_bin6]|nr:MAG: hypothetical protein A4S16_06745 [Proteobacteria bacterium SG_bin6]
MGAELKITDSETIKLAESLAAARGESVQQTIRDALGRVQAAMDADFERELAEKIAKMDEISRRFREKMPAEWHHMTSKQIMDSIYADDGSFA